MKRRAQVSVALITGGVGLLLVTTQQITLGGLLFPLAALVAGAVVLVRGFLPDGRESNVFLGTFLTLSGGFGLLWESALPTVRLQAIWPVFMTFGGAALIAYGLKRVSESRLSLVVPGVSIVVLSGVFLLFSLDIVRGSLSSVAVRWWPILLVVLGVFLFSTGWDSDSSDE